MHPQKFLLAAAAVLALQPAAWAADAGAKPAAAHGPDGGAACTGYGPQTPRDIDSAIGTNKRVATLAPRSAEMNLCNIHFHKNAEHKAKAYAIYAGDGDGHGYESGYQCGMSKGLSREELAPTQAPVCKGAHGDLKPGDTVEVHWVYTSCDLKGRDVKPGAGLGACVTKTCANPNLRVEAQVFTLVNDRHAADFSQFDYDGNAVNGYQQPNALPANTGSPVEFIGSTTGPSYTEQACSPLTVSWSVRPQCAKLDIATLGEWCKNNAFGEDHAHGVRKLVTLTKLLSPIGSGKAPSSKPAKPSHEKEKTEKAKAAAPAAKKEPL